MLKTEKEDEIHIYTDCPNTSNFWNDAQHWFRGTFGENPSLVLKGPRLFGLENEPPDDLHNIFYRSARYCIYLGRKKAFHPSIEVFKALIRDELRHKFKGKGDIDKCKNEAERTALQWLRVEMGWTLP